MELQKFVQMLKNHLDQETPNYQDGDAESLLEMLFNVYTEFNGFDNEIIRNDFNTLYEVMNGKTLREMDEISSPSAPSAVITKKPASRKVSKSASDWHKKQISHSNDYRQLIRLSTLFRK